MLNKLIAVASLSLVVKCASVPRSDAGTQKYATWLNFGEDLLDGHDGLTPHPTQPFLYGQPLYPITVDGNGREQFEGHLSYYEGRYWLHAATWGCGKVWVYAAPPPNSSYPIVTPQAPGDYGEDGNCGVKTFSSPDMTNWTLENFYQPESANVTKPLVRYSAATGQYVMFMGGPATSFYVTTGPSPAGPWADPPSLLQGEHLSHDFDIAQDANGTHYIVSDIFEGIDLTPTGVLAVPVWPIWVQELAPNLTSTVGTNSTVQLVRTAAQLLNNTDGGSQGLSLEAIGFFYNEDFDMWYIIAGKTCQNCDGYIYYLYSKNGPFGPYEDGGYISGDGCGGQNKGVMQLPSVGGSSFYAGNLLYRTSATDLVYNASIWHADNSQAIASANYYPFKYSSDGLLLPLECEASFQLPLAPNITETPSPPKQYQPDCRIRNWQNITVTFDHPKNVTEMEFPVFQRTDNLGPTSNAGYKMDGPLEVTFNFANGSSWTQAWLASNISWTPQKVHVDLDGASVSSIVMGTNATNGCYGTLVEENEGGSTYCGKNLVTGVVDSTPKAQLYVYKY
ncbi:hypothetical protein BD324DRAFT_413772 [Kockovaella imperatae]|uniref:Glycosyl hydrolase n=1 Tax=Kockovaella imperatae TaxID=4999 RepID=A0A1Y1ULM1_9TREE|nr:hypothetical protein BD324DRAFT_413772 [Kockovaella imperatae]ORX38015.1 hypothetical protein BD324DRAFT_413772 [Kockovaella imperatae]